MIKPHKYLNLDISVIKISALILKDLLQKRIVKYSDLYEKLKKKFGSDIDYVFLPALNYLYLQKAIIYHEVNDSFELVKRKDFNENK